jgi:EmrB/QacA subfamily drug resistance transporter
MTTAATPQGRRVTVAALLITLMLGALDQTIVATAMPRIISELKGLELYAWVTTVYLLTSTVMVPIWGKLGDQYGRKSILIIGLAIFVVGSCLCGLAGEFGDLPLLGGGMTQLIVFRGIQGIGGGALFTSAFAVIADLYPPRERGKLSGYFGAMFGVASLIGPVIGGLLTEHATVHFNGLTIAGWRWVFYVNLPLSALALFMIVSKMPTLTAGRGGKVDVLGALFIITAFVPLLLALSWGGHAYPWGSPLILGLFAVTVASLTAFLVVETRVPEPIVPLSLFKERVFSTCNGAVFILNMSFAGVVTFLPLYLQLGLGVPATASGAALLPMMIGVVASATLSGRLMSKTGRYKPIMVAGGVMLLGSMWLLSQIGPHTTVLGVTWRVCLLGLSLGPAQGLFSVAIQNAVPRDKIGVATSSGQFFRQIGATVGTAVFGAILTQSLTAGVIGSQGFTLERLQAMALQGGAAIPPSVTLAFSSAMANLFTAGLAIAALGFLVILLIPERPMAGREAPANEPAVSGGI